MAVTLETLELKFRSEAAAAASKDVAALQRVDEQVRRAQESLERLQGAAAKASAARVAAEDKVAAAAAKLRNAGEGEGGKVDLRQVAAARQGLAAAQQGADAARARAAGADDAVAAQEREIQKIAAARGQLDHYALAAAHAEDANKAQARSVEMVTGGMEAMAKAGAVVVAVLAAAAAAVIAFAFQAASAARNLGILGLALTRTEAGGQEFADIVRQLAREVPLAKDQIASLAAELSRSRLAGRDLQAGLTVVAIVTSALGDSAGGTIKSLIESSAAMRRFSLGARDAFGEFQALAGTGLRAADVLAALAKEMNTSVPAVEAALRAGRVTVSQGVRALEAAARGRFGKVIELQMLDATNQLQKAREAAADLFADVDLEGALRGLREVLSVLDQSTTTGRTFKALVVPAFQALANAAERAGPILKKMFQGALLAALLLYIKLKPVIDVIRDLGKKVDLDWLKVAAYAGAIAFAALALAAGVAGVAMLIALAPLIIVAALVVAGIYLIVKAFDAVKNTIARVTGAIASLDWSSLGSALIDGLISGITSRAGALIDSVRGLATQASTSFKQAMGIASPSKVFAAHGRQLPAGAAVGVDDNADELTRSVADMSDDAAAVAPGATPTAKGATPAAPASGPSIHIEHVYINGAAAGPDLMQQFNAAATVLLQNVLAMGGAGRVPA